MTIGELEIIVSKNEMQRLELKESFGAECIESACAFANAGGGFIVIGVDNKGNPSQRQLRFEGLRDYENKIATATELFAKEPQLRFSHARTKESIAKLGIDPVKLGFALDTEKSPENSGENTEKSTENSGENTGGGPNKSGKPKRLTETEARIVSILGKQNNATQGYIATQLGVTRTYVTQIMGNLQTQGVIRRVGPDKGGHWEVIGGEP